ncbi:MAG: hypothetical protein E4H40_05520, partial [Candidatus Brocadiia bacterium]
MNILRTLLAIMFIMTLSTSAFAQDNEKSAANVARYWIQIGSEQYDRGYYMASEQSFLHALDYQKYLTSEEQQKLNTLLGKAHMASLERKALEDKTKAAHELVKQGELLKARETLLTIKDSQYLTEQERKQINDTLGKLNAQVSTKQGEIAQIYNQSVELYQQGQ